MGRRVRGDSDEGMELGFFVAKDGNGYPKSETRWFFMVKGRPSGFMAIGLGM
jgi:hypothetical protein